MAKIILKELKDYDLTSIHEYLILQEDTTFELEMHFWPAAMPQKIFLYVLYIKAAYFGHLLSKVSDTFSHYVPLDTLDPVFKFRVSVQDLFKLAEVIYKMLEGYFGESELCEQYNDAEEQYWKKVGEMKIDTPVWGLVEAGMMCRG